MNHREGPRLGRAWGSPKMAWLGFLLPSGGTQVLQAALSSRTGTGGLPASGLHAESRQKQT